MQAILFIASLMLWLWAFWLLFILIMGFYREHLAGRLEGLAKILAAPIVVVGWLVDLISNWTIGTLLFLEPPRSPLEMVTQRLSRYMAGPPCRDKRIAEYVCTQLLDLFDPTGGHCK